MGEISNKEIISSPLIQTACYITGQTCTYFRSDNYSFWNPIYWRNMSMGFDYFLKLRHQWWSPHRNSMILYLSRMMFPRQYIGNIIGKDMKMFVIWSKWWCKINLPYCLHQLLSKDTCLHKKGLRCRDAPITFYGCHDDIIKWKHFPCYWPFVWEIHRSMVNFPWQRPVTWSFHVFFDLGLNKRLSRQSRCWWFGMPLCSLWHHCNVVANCSNITNGVGVLFELCQYSNY